jgi:hypothetical protein
MPPPPPFSSSLSLRRFGLCLFAGRMQRSIPCTARTYAAPVTFPSATYWENLPSLYIIDPRQKCLKLKHFPEDAVLAPPQAVEVLNFVDNTLPVKYEKTVRFTMSRAGIFQGFVLYITICTLCPDKEDITSWQRDTSSWPNMMVLFPATEVKVGDSIELHFSANVKEVLPRYTFSCRKNGGAIIASVQVPEGT